MIVAFVCFPGGGLCEPELVIRDGIRRLKDREFAFRWQRFCCLMADQDHGAPDPDSDSFYRAAQYATNQSEEDAGEIVGAGGVFA
jgi:hypothetical protein